MTSEKQVFDSLRKVMDPEIPTASIVGMGMIPSVEVSSNEVLVYLTPTFSGCPAINEIQNEIVRQLQADGIAPARVELKLTPVWTTDLIDEETRENLRAAGIAPPGASEQTLVQIGSSEKACPFCGSKQTEKRGEFGSTACKSLYFCRDCMQPFEGFKTVRDHEVIS